MKEGSLMQNLKIRAIAAVIMNELIVESDTKFSFTNFNACLIFDDDAIRFDHITKAIKYLAEKQYIISNVFSTTQLTGSITAKGIDWVEDFLNIDHTL